MDLSFRKLPAWPAGFPHADPRWPFCCDLGHLLPPQLLLPLPLILPLLLLLIVSLVPWLGPIGPRRATAETPMSARQTESLARIDSLWHARAQDAARALIAAELPGARAAADSAYWMHLAVRQGHLDVALGDNLRAEPTLREALELAVALHDSVRECVSLRWLGVTVSSLGRPAEARTIYAVLRDRATSYGDNMHLGWAGLGLGFCEWHDGHLDDARLELLRSAALLQEEGEARGELLALNLLGNVLTSLGAYEEARDCFTRTISVSGEMGFLYAEAMAENNLGTLEYSLGDPGNAMRHFERGRALHREDGSVRESIVPAANITNCQIALGQHREALAILEPLLEECREGGYRDLEAMVVRRIVHVRSAQGRYRAAVGILRRTMANESALGTQDQVENLLALADALAAQDSAQTALDLLRAREDWVAHLSEPLLRVQFWVEEAERFLEVGDDGLALDRSRMAWELADSVDLSGFGLRARALGAMAASHLARPAEAIAHLEEAAAIWEAERQVPLDPIWRAQRGASARQIYPHLGALLLTYPPEQSSTTRAARSFDALQVFKSRTLLERISGPGVAGDADESTHAVTLADLQSGVLADGELLLDFYVGPDVSLLFAVNRQELRAITLPGVAEFEPALMLLHELLSTPPEPGTDAADAALLLASTMTHVRGLLFAEVADLLRSCRRLLYAPDGALNLLPIAAVLMDAPDAPDGSGMLPAETELERLPSATFLARLRARRSRQPSTPQPSAAQPSAVQSSSAEPSPAQPTPAQPSPAQPTPAATILAVHDRGGAGGARLSGARREVESLANRYKNVSSATAAVIEAAGGPSLRGAADGENPDASSRTPRGLAAYDILHFAAHSTVDDQSPWRSAIHLHAPGAPDGELVLHARRIAEMDLTARLAVLASCASAGGRILSGEGVQGLTSAFLSAGVPAVIATLWPVDDRGTAELMARFYAHLAGGDNVADALRQAQLDLSRTPGTEHPFFWAGFVLTGDGDLTLSLEPRPRLWRAGSVLALSALGLLALVAGTVLLRRRLREALASPRCLD